MNSIINRLELKPDELSFLEDNYDKNEVNISFKIMINNIIYSIVIELDNKKQLSYTLKKVNKIIYRNKTKKQFIYLLKTLDK